MSVFNIYSSQVTVNINKSANTKELVFEQENENKEPISWLNYRELVKEDDIGIIFPKSCEEIHYYAEPGSCLHRVCQHNGDDPKIIDCFIEKSLADVNKICIWPGAFCGLSPIMVACEYGKFKMVKRLCKHGAVIDLFGHNLIYYCVRDELGNWSSSARVPLLKYLIRSGVSPKWSIYSTMTSALHMLCSKSESISEGVLMEMIEIFLKSGCDVNALDNNKWTPMHFAVLKNRPRLVKFLIAKKADPYIQDAKGRSVIDIARIHNTDNTILTILEKNTKSLD